MSGYVPSLVLLGGLYLEHRKEKLGKQFDAGEAWAEFIQFINDKQANAWDEGNITGQSIAMRRMSGEPQAPSPHNPYRE